MIRDEVNEEVDYHLSTFVINSHIKNHPYMNQYEFSDIPALEENDEKYETV